MRNELLFNVRICEICVHRTHGFIGNRRVARKSRANMRYTCDMEMKKRPFLVVALVRRDIYFGSL